MNAKIMPIQKLISDCDNIPFSSKTCCYGACSNKPITSHTFSENYLFKLSDDLANVLTFQPKVSQVVKTQNPQRVIKVEKRNFQLLLVSAKPMIISYLN